MELIIARENRYNEFCEASKAHLLGTITCIAHNLSQPEKITISVRETGKTASVTIHPLSPNVRQYNAPTVARTARRLAI
jgi:hypothetical protein